MECKNICSSHKDIFVNKNKTLLLGIDVYFCKACNIFIRFKEILSNFVNSIFHKQLKKYRCACCSNKLRTKVTTKRHKLLRNKTESPNYKPGLHSQPPKKCACGCGTDLKLKSYYYKSKKYYYYKSKKYVNIKHANRHKSLLVDQQERSCYFCNTQDSPVNKTGKGLGRKRWHKYENLGYLCESCYRKDLKRKKLNTIQITFLNTEVSNP